MIGYARYVILRPFSWKLILQVFEKMPSEDLKFMNPCIVIQL